MNTLKQMHAADCTISHNLTDKYAPVSSRLFLQPFKDQGWAPVKHVTAKDKEWISLEHPDYKFSNDDTLRVEVINSYNGSCALNIMGGLGRLVCSNGLVIGRDFEKFRFVHRGTKIYDKLKDSYDLIVAKLDKLKSDVDRLQSINLKNEQVDDIITNIYKEALESDTNSKKVTLSSIPNHVLLLTQKSRRKEDQGRDAFTIMNVVQERIIRGGVFGAYINELEKETNISQKRYVTKRGSENKFGSIKMNDIISSNFLSLAN